MSVNWLIKSFDSLTPYELYAILRLRNEIFVVEQNCVFQDADNKDQESFHLMGWDKEELHAYTRIVPATKEQDIVSIGRVLVAVPARGKGLGKLLMEESILEIRRLYGQVPILIGAQCHLTSFYNGLGFQIEGKPYLEDGIDHIKMILPN